jgi:hypothetical protein
LTHNILLEGEVTDVAPKMIIQERKIYLCNKATLLQRHRHE